ncbi:MAG: SLBB domain-containing protein [Chthonomonadales bacterium]
MRITVVSLLAALLLACGAGNALAQGGTQTSPPADQTQLALGSEATFNPNQPIKPGFTLSITTTSAAGPESDFSGVFPVDPSGAIDMKLVGRIELRGLMPDQAADKVAALLKPFLKEPKVSLAIIAVPRPVVFLGGSVTKPGAVLINDGTTLAEVLALYGFTDNADLSDIRVYHRDEKGVRTVKDVNFLLWLKPAPGSKPDESQNPVLADRDLVYVPMKSLPAPGMVSVEGDVAKPGLVPVRVGVPTQLREVISLAGGLNPTADRHQITVRHYGADKTISVDFDKVEQGDPSANITLGPDDVVYVAKLGPDQFINLNGAFVRPGRLPYQKPMTLTQAVGEAGGLLPYAKEKQARIYRHPGGSADPSKTEVIKFNYGDVRSGKQRDVLLQPGDTIEIPQGQPRPVLDPFQVTTLLVTIAVLVTRRY